MAYDYDSDARKKQEEDKRKSRRVYSTALIDELVKERNMGYDIPYDAFFMRDLDLRAPNVTFKMTDEEMEEYQRCYDDAEYYVENYCKFMTDHGLQVVELRDFQKNVVKTVTDEVYIPSLGEWGPKNRNVIWMAARQSGKCLIFNQLADVKQNSCENISDHPNKITVSDIYYIDKKKSFLEKIKSYLYKIYKKL